MSTLGLWSPEEPGTLAHSGCMPKPCFPSLQVTGEVKDESGKVHFVLLGTWDEKMDCFKVQPVTGDNGGDARLRGHEAEESRVTLWQRNPLP